MTEILLAAYNGGRYIGAQVESILSQSFTDWHLTIADDGSSDDTYEVISAYAMEHPDKITVIRRDKGTGSAKANFMKLIEETDADWTAFSDQDDVWHKDKLEKMMSAAEDTSAPVLVYSDARVTDKDMNVTAQSFMRFQGLDPACRSLQKLLAQNNVTGMSMMVNRPLAELMKGTDPSVMLMHDWWAALAAAAFGRIVYIDEALADYRQHDNNQLGAVNNRSISGVKRIMSDTAGVRKRLRMTFEQAAAFSDRYGDILPQDKKAVLDRYLAIPAKNKPGRMLGLVSGGYLKQNIMSALGQLFYC
ncbi:MAG: glycosyltransferase family 2 protein [Oscillospiraceae bacterium]|nr:glycosyltransferase family 2 protein [Oscillospiraceae bacterium]